MLYVDAAVLQVGLYFFNRRHNVSPHEDEGSTGLAGMLISALSAPIYVSSLVAVALRRKGGFVTTPKGDSASADSIATFRRHLQWSVIFGLPLAASFAFGNDHPAMRIWSARLARDLPAAGRDLALRPGAPDPDAQSARPATRARGRPPRVAEEAAA